MATLSLSGGGHPGNHAYLQGMKRGVSASQGGQAVCSRASITCDNKTGDAHRIENPRRESALTAILRSLILHFVPPRSLPKASPASGTR